MSGAGTEVLGPPDGWTELPGDAVMTNCDHEIDRDMAEELRAGGHWAGHAAWDFYGKVWYADGRWHEQVLVYGAVRGAYSADTLEELMGVVNNQYGWG